MLESEVEKKLVQGVKKLGGMCLKWVSPGYAGVPDRIVILPGGRVYFVELKQDRGRLSPRQKYVHKQLYARDVSLVTLYGVEGVREFLSEVDVRVRFNLSTKRTWYQGFMTGVLQAEVGDDRE